MNRSAGGNKKTEKEKQFITSLALENQFFDATKTENEIPKMPKRVQVIEHLMMMKQN
jgi:hypothetical protein